MPLAHRVATLGSQDVRCPCEAIKMGSESSGPVLDEQILHFLVTDPQAIQNGKINPAALSQICKDGLSTIRAEAPVEEYERVLDLLNTRSHASASDERFFDSVLIFPASIVRYADNDERLLCVYDTSLPDQPNHVDLMSPNAHLMTSNQVKRLAKKLRDLLTVRVSGAELFDGKLIGYMREH